MAMLISLFATTLHHAVFKKIDAVDVSLNYP